MRRGVGQVFLLSQTSRGQDQRDFHHPGIVTDHSLAESDRGPMRLHCQRETCQRICDRGEHFSAGREREVAQTLRDAASRAPGGFFSRRRNDTLSWNKPLNRSHSRRERRRLLCSTPGRHINWSSFAQAGRIERQVSRRETKRVRSLTQSLARPVARRTPKNC